MIPHTYSPLSTDLYQLTMAYGYWHLKMHDQMAVFHLIYRKNPFKGNYAISCGLASIVDYLKNWTFKKDDLVYLKTLRNTSDEQLFPDEFLAYLSKLTFSCNIDAIPEGTIVFPNMPLLRIEGPLLQCQLLETPLLNFINFQTLVATKASRVCRAAAGDEVIEFGMRRAQGPDGALSASRAAYIGGCNGTSNTLAGKYYDIPVMGTHAHSWVTAFANEKEAFAAYANSLPHHCVLLVDTYDTINGIKNAIYTAKTVLKENGNLLGVRLDSGNLADLSKKARTLLDDAGLEKTSIIASNSLDEYVITDLKKKGAKISAWGVGTHLATAYDHPALDGVYKLSSMMDKEGKWEYKLKLSEDMVKISNPGRHQVRRFFFNEQIIMDVLYDLDIGISDTPSAVLINTGHEKKLDDCDGYVDLLIPIFNKGKFIQKPKSIHEIRQDAKQEVEQFYKTHNENHYPIGIEKNLYALKLKLIGKVKKE